MRSLRSWFKVIAIIAVLLAVWRAGRQPRWVDVIEKLDHPVEVVGWTSEGLQLADGRVVQLPDFQTLPAQSDALAHTTRFGVEVADDGRVVGLIRSYHTYCLPAAPFERRVRLILARVDLAYLLMYLDEGEFELPDPDLKTKHVRTVDRFEGWHASELGLLEAWSKLLDLRKRSAAQRRLGGADRQAVAPGRTSASILQPHQEQLAKT